jgi:Tfp pilus assembly protein PilN
MTTTLMPPEIAVSAEGALRLLPIVANLLPAEIVESRRVRRVRRIVLSAVAAFVVLLAVWYGLASHQTSTARGSLSTAEDNVARLQQQQRAFTDVVKTQADSQAIRAQLAALLAEDLQWSRLLSALQDVAPTGVQVTGVSGALTAETGGAGGSGSAGGSAGVRLPNTSGEKPIGTLTVTGTGTSKSTVAEYVDALAKVSGFASPLLGDAILQDGVLQFTVRLDITESALSGQYTSKNTNEPRGK